MIDQMRPIQNKKKENAQIANVRSGKDEVTTDVDAIKLIKMASWEMSSSAAME